VRQAMKSRESPDVQAAILAVHLGLIDEAENILAGKKRVTFALIVFIFYFVVLLDCLRRWIRLLFT
jgi:hypothetical protein